VLRILFSCLAAALFIGSAANDSRATSVVRFPFNTLCLNAPRILRVRCLSTAAEIDSDRNRVFTRTQFEVLETIKGPAPGDGRIDLVLPGGRVDGLTQVVPGMPVFREQEEIVLFLTALSDTGSPWPMGLYQGCYGVRTDSDGQRQVELHPGVTPLPGGAAFKPVSDQPFRVDLHRFRQAVLNVLAGSPGAASETPGK